MATHQFVAECTATFVGIASLCNLFKLFQNVFIILNWIINLKNTFLVTSIYMFLVKSYYINTYHWMNMATHQFVAECTATFVGITSLCNLFKLFLNGFIIPNWIINFKKTLLVTSIYLFVE